MSEPAVELDDSDEAKPVPAPKWSELGMPLPRLQLTWEKLDKPVDGYNWVCKYEMLMPLTKYDIRNEPNYWGFYAASLGGTRSDREGPPDRWGKLEAPFRDGAHALWDAIHLGMPAFVVYGDKYRRIASPDSQWPPVPETGVK